MSSARSSAIAAVCIGPDDDMEQRRRDILDSVAKVEDGEGVVLLTDMFGGTPSNLAISVMDRAKVEVIAGVNLPMLIKLASVRSTEKLPEAVTAGPGGRAQIHQRRLAAPGRRRQAERMDAAAERVSRVGDHLQPARPARPRRGEIRQARRASSTPRSRCGKRRSDRLRPLDHGADDARRRRRQR